MGFDSISVDSWEHMLTAQESLGRLNSNIILGPLCESRLVTNHKYDKSQHNWVRAICEIQRVCGKMSRLNVRSGKYRNTKS